NDSIGMVALPLQNADLYGVVMRMLVQDEEEVRIEIEYRSYMYVGKDNHIHTRMCRCIVLVMPHRIASLAM
ncbi:MAG: hypothetical protein MJE68_25160, partial [Proteobacteria bacterium]|nr:hypothetical protein [Pseudomonadota bacterium]